MDQVEAWYGAIPALPLLQRRHAPLYAGLIVGVVSTLWHVRAFLMSGTKQSARSFWPYFFGVIAIGVILTAMFNAADGSLPIAVLLHAQMNCPAWPAAQPWDMVGFVLVAIAVARVNRHMMLRRDSGSTRVLLGDVPHEHEPSLGRSRAVPLTP